jgi:hypothetical protein
VMTSGYRGSNWGRIVRVDQQGHNWELHHTETTGNLKKYKVYRCIRCGLFCSSNYLHTDGCEIDSCNFRLMRRALG